MEISKVMFDSWHASVHVFFSEVLHQETVQGEFSHCSKVVEGNMERQLSPDTSLGQILLFMTWETQLRKYAFLNTTTTDTKGSVQFSSVTQSCPTLCNPWTAARQASLSITNSQSLSKLKSIELVMPSNHLILCRPLLLLPSTFPNIRVFSNESVLCIRWPKYCSFSFSIKAG